MPKPGTDSDQDGIPDAKDKCPYTANANQTDSDHDGVGDVCDTNDGNEASEVGAGGMALRGGCTAGPTGGGHATLWLGMLAALALLLRRVRTQGLAALLLLFVAMPAFAAGNVDVEQFNAVPVGSGVLNQWQSATPGHLQWGAGISAHYANQPLRLVPIQAGDGRSTGSVIPGLLHAEALARLGLLDWLEVDAAIPFVATLGTPDTTIGGRSVSDLKTAALGDIRLALGADLTALFGWKAAGADGFGLGVRVTTWLPTGNATAFQSEGAVHVEPRLVGDWRHGRWLFGANVGWMARSRSQVFNVVNDDAMTWGVFGRGPIAGPVDWLATVYGSLQSAKQLNPLDATQRAHDGTNSPLEALLGVRADLNPWDVTLAAGPGLNGAVGTPTFRVVLQAGYAPHAIALETPVVLDTDGDGLLDPDDKCPLAPEDKDGFEDADGCPDPDNDKDGILDIDDKCPNQPETRNGYEDADGCPDTPPDRDKDGIPDAADKCPDDPTDKCMAAAIGDEIVIYERVEFATNKAVIRPESYTVLDVVVSVLQAHPELTRIEVQGHTDADGEDQANLALSAARAAAVVDYLVKKGADRTRLKSTGYGETRPVAPNDTPENKQKNRRVQFVFSSETVREKAPGGKAGK